MEVVTSSIYTLRSQCQGLAIIITILHPRASGESFQVCGGHSSSILQKPLWLSEHTGN